MIRKIVTGEYQPHLESALASEVRALKRADPLEPAAIVVPTNALGLHLSRTLAAELGGHAEVRTLTLLDLARRLGLRSLAGSRMSLMPPAADILLLRRSIDRYLSGRDRSYFSRVASRDGFPRVLLAAIVDMKEGSLTPGDLERAVRSAGLGGIAEGKIAEVSAIWRIYEEEKRTAGLYDRADLMAEAAHNAAGDSSIADVSRLIFYGFYDLNSLQRRLVGSCAANADTVFFFPFVDSEDYEYARPTLRWLIEMGFTPERGAGGGAGPGGARAVAAAREASQASASGEASSGAGPGGAAAGASAESSIEGGPKVLILSAAGEERECREAVREVLRLAGLGRGAGGGADGFRLNDLGILLRDPSRYAERFARAFEALGVEPFVGEGLPLLGTRAGRSLHLLIDLVEGEFSRRDVMDFLTYAELNPDALPAGNGGFAPAGGSDRRGGSGVAGGGSRTLGAKTKPALWDLVSKEAGIVGGMDDWRGKLSAAIGGTETSGGRRGRGAGPSRAESGQGAPVGGRGQNAAGDRRAAASYKGAASASGAAAAKSLLAIVEYLWDAVSSLRDSGSPAHLVEELCALYCSLVVPGRERDAVAGALRGLSALESCSGSIERSSFHRLVRDHLETTRVRVGSLHGEGPVIAGLMTSRGLPFKVVIVPGLVEGLFPMPARQDPILLDGERRALNAALEKEGIDGWLALKSERTKEEKLLFRLAVGSASRHLLLSYPRIDPATSAEHLPSEFLLEVAGAVAGARCGAAGLDALPFNRRVPLARLFPDDGSFMDRIEFDLMAADRAVAGDAAAADHLKGGSGFLGKSLEAERRRWGEFNFTPYDGVLESPDAVKPLLGGFLGRHGVASPTALECYAGCPFLYFMRHIMKIEPVEEPEEVLEVAPMDRGALAHSILERAYGRIFHGGSGPREGWERELARIASELLDEFRQDNPFGLPLLWELERRRLVDDLVASVGEDLDDLGGFTPWRFELRYGLGGPAGDAPNLTLDDGRTVPIGGKIDRVDIDRSDGTARIIDYKTGSGKAFRDACLMGGRTLQLPLYVVGARHVLGDETDVTGAEYYFVSGARRGERVRFTSADVAARMGDVVAIVSTIARSIERGIFFAYPSDSCSYCDYRMACEPARILFERKQTDPRAQEYLRMRNIE